MKEYTPNTNKEIEAIVNNVNLLFQGSEEMGINTESLLAKVRADLVLASGL